MMPAAAEDLDKLWTLSDDRQFVRFSMPPLPIEGLDEPLRITLDFDADMVDEVLQRLTALRAQMGARH